MISYAQNFEDILLWRALKNIKQGKYIDIGAQHPTIDSISKLFYLEGWRGIHVEPLSEYVEMFRNDRPEDRVIEAAVSNQQGIIRFFEIQDSGLSTSVEEIAEHHRSQGWNVREITVPAITLDDVFTLLNDSVVHWLKIDVEGHERQVLEGWSEKILPWIVVIESTFPCSQIDTHEAWEELLLKKGYSFTYHDGLNRYYISPDHPDLAGAFQFGPNVFDGFQLANHHWAVSLQRQQIETQRAEAKAREDELRRQAAQQIEAQRAASAQQIESLQAKISVAQHALLERERAISAQIIALRAEERQHIEVVRHTAEERIAQLEQQLSGLRRRLEAHRAHAQAREDEIRRQAVQQLQAQQAVAARQIESLHSQIMESQRRHQALIAQQQHVFAELQRQLEEQRAQAQVREDAIRQQAAQQLQAQQDEAAQQIESLQSHIAELQRQYEAQLTQHQNALAELQRQLEEQRAQAQAREDEIREQAEQILLAQHTSAQQWSARVKAIESTRWWRFSKLWRRAEKWPAIAPPTLVDLQTALTPPVLSESSGQTKALTVASPAHAVCSESDDGHPEISHPIHNPKNQAMKIQHITELFSLDGPEFITETYRNLLRRDPDEHGMAYYLGRLAQGYGKASIIVQIARSPECRPWDEVKGLKHLVAQEKRAQHWFFRLFTRRRMNVPMQPASITRFDAQQSTRLFESLEQLTQALGNISRQIEIKAPHVSTQDGAPGPGQTHTPPLAAGLVRNAFVHILGREPESKKTLNHHAQFESFAALRESLYNSEEFQLKLANLPEYARSIFLRQLRLQLTKLEG